MHLGWEKIREIAQVIELDVLSATKILPLVGEEERLRNWQERGYAGDMSYMLREPELYCSPLSVFEEALSLVIFGVPYESASHPELRLGYGRVARYAWGLDYHEVLRAALQNFVAACEGKVGQAIKAKVFSDSVPLLERSLAAKAGLGFIGKNSLLIRKGFGSNLFLAELLWDLEIDGAPALEEKGTCGKCSLCRRECPTGAIVADRVVDARRCISYLSIEKRESLLLEERRALGEWVFGCDICQDTCPFNKASMIRPKIKEYSDFHRDRGVGPVLNLSAVLGVRENKEFKARFSGTPLLRAKREGLLRNAAVVGANTLAESVLPALERAFSEDTSAMVRQHSFWALSEMYKKAGSFSKERFISYVEKALHDESPLVREEASLCT